MGDEARKHWDRRYADAPRRTGDPFPLFASHLYLLPEHGTALDVACGTGRGSVALAERGLSVLGVDVSGVAIGLAVERAERSGVSGRCQFLVHDLDHGLPEGEPVDLIVCYLFRDPALDQALLQRLKPGGTLAIACLSEVGAAPGRFRAAAGELISAFGDLEIQADGEGNGNAWLIGRR